MLRPIVEFLLELAATPWGVMALILHGYLEAFILPGPHEAFLIPLCLSKPKMSLIYALLSTTFSTLGILTGYCIGRWGGHRILKKIMKAELLEKAEYEIQKYDFWAIAIACFTPLPVKVFGLLAGTFRLSVPKLALVAFISRGARFGLVAVAIYFYGESAKEIILKYSDWIMIGLLIFMGFSYFVWSKAPHEKNLKSEI